MSRPNSGTPASMRIASAVASSSATDARGRERRLQRVRLRALDEQVEARLAGVGDARDDRRAARPRRRARCRAPAAPRSASAETPLTIAATTCRRVRTDDRDLRERVGDVAELHVLGEDELIELRQHGVLHARRHRQQHHVAELVDEAGPRSSVPAPSGTRRSSPAPPCSATMSLVSRPCRYDARSVPDTTMRPRSRAIEERRAMARGVVRRRRKRPESWCYAEACPRSILSVRRSRRRRSPLPLGAAAQQPAAPPPLQEAGATNFTIFLRRRADRQRADRGHAHRQRLDHRQHRAPGRADRRRRAAPAGALHAGLEAARVHARRHRPRTGADDSHRRRRHDREERHHRRRPDRRRRPTRSIRTRCCCCRTASSARTKRSPRG